MFIPYTPESTLKSALTRAEASLNYNTRVKYVEELGLTIKAQLVRADPDPKPCGRQDCFPCKTKPGQCMRQNTLYRIDCQRCKDEDEASVYFCESARAVYDRGAEHWAALETNNKESPLVEHQEEVHGGDRVD